MNIDPDGIIEQYGLGVVIGEANIKKYNADFESLARFLGPVVEKLLFHDLYRKQMGVAGKEKEYVGKIHAPKGVVASLIEVLEKRKI